MDSTASNPLPFGLTAEPEGVPSEAEGTHPVVGDGQNPTHS
jgi:hypothetical protein